MRTRYTGAMGGDGLFQVCSAVERSPDSVGMKMLLHVGVEVQSELDRRRRKHLQRFIYKHSVSCQESLLLSSTRYKQHTHVRAHTPTQTKGIDRYIPLVMAEVKRMNDVWEGEQSSFNRWAFKLNRQNIFLVSPIVSPLVWKVSVSQFVNLKFFL